MNNLLDLYELQKAELEYSVKEFSGCLGRNTDSLLGYHSPTFVVCLT